MALENYNIRQITNALAAEVVIEKHYLHRRPPCSIAFGLYLGEELKGVICYGTPSSSPLRAGIAGIEQANNVIELTRLWVDDSVPRNGESYLIGNTLPKCGKEIVVSYADTAQQHVGTVYQATNWLYTGLSAKRTDYHIEGMDKHGQTLADKHTSKELRAMYGDKFSLKPRSRKHRYIFINAKGKRKQLLLSLLKYKQEPYPKKS